MRIPVLNYRPTGRNLGAQESIDQTQFNTWDGQDADDNDDGQRNWIRKFYAFLNYWLYDNIRVTFISVFKVYHETIRVFNCPHVVKI